MAIIFQRATSIEVKATITINEYDLRTIKQVKEAGGRILAVKVLRMIYPGLDLRDAINVIDKLEM